MKRVAVLGRGNGSFAMASDLSLQGFQVTLWSEPFDELKKIQKTHTIKVSGPLVQGEAKIHRITDDIEGAVQEADLICAPIPAFTQPSIAKRLSPFLKDGQVIFLSPGTFGSYVMYRALRDRGCQKDIAIAETGTLPYLTRKISPEECRIVVRACHLPTGIFPARKTEEASAKIKIFFPSVHPVEDALSAALLNAGPVIHPPLIVLNTGPVESPLPYDIHNEGTTPGIRRTIALLDQERIAVREAFGYRPNHYPLEDYYNDTGSKEWMYPKESKKLLMSSHLWHEKIDYSHRYVREDIAYGLAFLISAAQYAGVDVPIARSLITLAGVIAGTDFMKRGRTLDSLGFSGTSAATLKEILSDGI